MICKSILKPWGVYITFELHYVIFTPSPPPHHPIPHTKPQSAKWQRIYVPLSMVWKMKIPPHEFSNSKLSQKLNFPSYFFYLLSFLSLFYFLFLFIFQHCSSNKLNWVCTFEFHLNENFFIPSSHFLSLLQHSSHLSFILTKKFSIPSFLLLFFFHFPLIVLI